MLNMADQEQKNYYYKVNAEYAEAMFQKMASIRYGIDFCCTPDLTKWSIKKELLDMNNNMDSVCPDPDNPAQPGDENFIPGPCAKIDIATSEGGGSITYVPCGSYKEVTETYTGNGNVIICYDTNVGYIANPNCSICFQITESLEECNSTPSCVNLVFGFPKGGGQITYTDCEGVYNVYLFQDNVDPRLINRSWIACIQEGKYTISHGVSVKIGESCTSVCNSYIFNQNRGTTTINYVDCNGINQTTQVEEYGSVGPLCVKSFNPTGDVDQLSIVFIEECITVPNNTEC
jgi:hypothetical protein